MSLLLDNHLHDGRDDRAYYHPRIREGSLEPTGGLNFFRVKGNLLHIAVGCLDGLMEGILEVDNGQVEVALALLC